MFLCLIMYSAARLRWILLVEASLESSKRLTKTTAPVISRLSLFLPNDGLTRCEGELKICLMKMYPNS